jgi:hypothetical protein
MKANMNFQPICLTSFQVRGNRKYLRQLFFSGEYSIRVTGSDGSPGPACATAAPWLGSGRK